MDSQYDPFEGDEDAALRYAIELSLQDLNDSHTSPPTGQKQAAPGVQGDEDDVLQDATTNSGKESVQRTDGNPQKSKQATSPLKTLPQSVLQDVSPGGHQFLGLDRKKMEEERLARVAKRKAPSDDEVVQQPPQRRAKIDDQADASSHVATTTNSFTLPYPKGVVKKTWVSGVSRVDDIKIEEILQKDQLELAVLSSFQWDDTWLLSKIDIRKTKMVCIAFASDEAHKEAMRANVPQDRIRFCFPPMMPAGNMHSKLQLLKFSNYLRVVIPTGNLVPYDWGETGVMENMVFLIDLPIAKHSIKATTSFGQELCYFLKASGLDGNMIDSLSKYDFSATEPYRFIHTIGQPHKGYCGLGRAVKSLGFETQSGIELDFVAASLGSINRDLISAIYGAAQGDSGLTEYEKRTGGGGKRKDAQKTELGCPPDNFRIYFPSHDTVLQSRGGKNSGGTICLQRKWWESATFPRELIRDCKSVRPGVLMHTKILFVRHLCPEKSQVSWAYLGSANLSESAWGRLVKDKASGQPKLNCRNWECGVLIPIEGGSVEPGLKSFEKTIPVPMVVPSEAYGKTDSKRPWFSFEN